MIDDVKEITDLLTRFPAQIHEVTVRAENLREIWTLEDALREYEQAGAFLKAKALGMTEGQAKAKAVEEVFVQTQNTIKAESAYRRALADQSHLENEFASVRKRANLVEAAIQRFGRDAA